MDNKINGWFYCRIKINLERVKYPKIFCPNRILAEKNLHLAPDVRVTEYQKNRLECTKKKMWLYCDQSAISLWILNRIMCAQPETHTRMVTHTFRLIFLAFYVHNNKWLRTVTDENIWVPSTDELRFFCTHFTFFIIYDCVHLNRTIEHTFWVRYINESI
jgi:hypothetical protein